MERCTEIYNKIDAVTATAPTVDHVCFVGVIAADDSVFTE